MKSGSTRQNHLCASSHPDARRSAFEGRLTTRPERITISALVLPRLSIGVSPMVS